jgi:hypothetical protein
MLRLPLAVLASLVVLASDVSAQVVGTTRLRGVVTQPTGAALPGVIITAQGQSKAVTAADGSYEVEALVQGPQAAVTVTAEYPGLQPVRINVTASPGSVTQVPLIRMRVLCTEVDPAAAPGLAVEARQADAVVHLRVNALSARRGWELRDGCLVVQEVDATVVADLRNRLVGQRLSVLVPPDRPRLMPRDELVAFLTWDAAAQRYVSVVYNLPVVKGLVAVPEGDALREFATPMRMRVLFDRLR